ncbi:translation initiation factor IF-2-like [Phocoena sinus]|uniref:translation initiation factor IF-2-like n=1 Tax=Phocoena sinus TaxID=42100 RepID=UPI0013C4479B|nr:translation initiation factor IF-2-like [Phocoena sinus]
MQTAPTRLRAPPGSPPRGEPFCGRCTRKPRAPPPEPSIESVPSFLASFLLSFLPSFLAREEKGVAEMPTAGSCAAHAGPQAGGPALAPPGRPPPASAARPPPPLPEDWRPAAAAAAAVARRCTPLLGQGIPRISQRAGPPSRGLPHPRPLRPSPSGRPPEAGGARREGPWGPAEAISCKVKRAPNAKGDRKNTAPRPLTEPRNLDSRRSARPNGLSTHPKAAPSTPKSRRAGIWLTGRETLQVAPGSRELQRPGHNLAKTCATVTEDVPVETLLRRGETALGGAPLASSPPPHLQPTSRRPPASGPRAPRAAVSSRPPPGDRGGRRARHGGPSPSGRGGSSQQQRRPLTWKVTAEKKEEEDAPRFSMENATLHLLSSSYCLSGADYTSNLWDGHRA